MSWQTYVTNLEDTKKVTTAAICGLDGSTWAASQGIAVKPTEATTLVNSFSNPANLAMTGIVINDKKYFFLSGNDEVLRGKKDKDGVYVFKTNQAIVIGTFSEPIQAAEVAVEIDKVGTYLKGLNY